MSHTSTKMNKKQTTTTTFLGCCFLSLLLFAGCDAFNKSSIEPDMSSIDDRVVTANTEFGFNLFDEIRKTEQGKNMFISPFSISVALAMTLNGAAGETEQAMTDTLQLQGLNSESINAGYAGLHQTLLTSDPKVTLTIANSLWARQDVPFKQDFLQRNTKFFGAEISTLDFSDPSASKTINQWVDTQTRGKLKKIVSDAIDADTVLFLINAIYFKGTWQIKFDPSETRDGIFYLATGAEKQTSMMTRTGDYSYYANYDANFQALSLPYGSGRTSMYIFLPGRESDLDAFLEHLNTERWEQWISEFYQEEVYLALPKFKLEYEKRLNDPLKALGMEVAFSPSRADFGRMAPLEMLDGNLYIGEVLQKAVLEVNEEGAEATAATKVEVKLESAPPVFIVDRPFFFAIRDNQTKTVLFMGVLMEP